VGMVPLQNGEESEARNRTAFDSLGQKLCVFGTHLPELPSLQFSDYDLIY
jgi:hypothetical protein